MSIKGFATDDDITDFFKWCGNLEDERKARKAERRFANVAIVFLAVMALAASGLTLLSLNRADKWREYAEAKEAESWKMLDLNQRVRDEKSKWFRESLRLEAELAEYKK